MKNYKELPPIIITEEQFKNKKKQMEIQQQVPSWLKEAKKKTQTFLNDNAELVHSFYTVYHCKEIWIQKDDMYPNPIVLHFNYTNNSEENCIIVEINQNIFNGKINTEPQNKHNNGKHRKFSTRTKTK